MIKTILCVAFLALWMYAFVKMARVILVDYARISRAIWIKNSSSSREGGQDDQPRID